MAMALREMASRLALIVLALALGACRGEPAEAPPARPASEPSPYLNLGPEAAYVGNEACGSCHGRQYESFRHSEMGRSFREATLTNSDANFEDPAPIYDEANDLFYLPFHRGEDLFVMEYRLAGRDTLHKRVERIDYIIGSGHHTNSHLREVNGYVYQIPVTWYAQEGRWDLAPGFRRSPETRFSRPITETCMSCHNALPGFVEGSENRFSHVPLGISCERCHGPGSLHVEQMRMGQLVDTSRQADVTIVNPARLAPERQLDVCARCHAQGAVVYREGLGPADFRPGMRLEDVENSYMVRYADSTAHFIMASHPDRLRMSPCFRATHEPGSPLPPMTCITCHDPHVSIAALDYNPSCQSCHASEHAARCTEPSVVAAGGVGNCVACHMPASGSTDIPHVTITDHFIRVVDPAERALSAPEVEARREVVRLASLVAVTPSDRDAADGFMAFYEEMTNRPAFLDSAAARMRRARAQEPLQTLAPSLIRLEFLRGDFAALRELARRIDTEPLDAWALYRIGEAFAKAGEHEPALAFLRRAVERAPYHLRFRQQLATALVNAGEPRAALEEFDRLLAEDPTFEAAYTNRGFARLQLGELAEAEADFLEALRLDPDAEMAMANLASLYLNTGRPAEARPYAERLLALDPENAGYRRLREALRAEG